MAEPPGEKRERIREKSGDKKAEDEAQDAIDEISQGSATHETRKGVVWSGNDDGSKHPSNYGSDRNAHEGVARLC
jgi:hypothetical protein